MEDLIVREVDVYVNRVNDEDIGLFQFPNCQLGSESNNVIATRFKSQSYILEMSLKLDTESLDYSKDRAIELARTIGSSIDTQILLSNRIPVRTIEMAGIFIDNSLILVPISSIIQLRPTFHYLNNKEEPTRNDIGPEKIVFQTQYRKRESEEERASRLKSFSYHQKLADEESWRDYRYIPQIKATETINRIFSTTSKDIEFPMNYESEFFQTNFGFNISDRTSH
jgi:DNA-directed RNA polymerase III subunit RPC5